MIFISIILISMFRAVLLAIFTSVATGLGGLLALKVKDRLHLLLGLAAGLMLGLVGFDLIPSVLKGNKSSIGNVPVVTLVFVLGFLILHVVEKSFATHEPHDSEYEEEHEHHHHRAGTLAAVAMAGHVFADGLGIGAAFQVSNSLGAAVFLAISVHAFSDGLNTVTFLIKEHMWTKKAIGLLVVDAVGRVSGAAIGSYFAFSQNYISLYLAIFAGFVIYIATSHILPEAHAKHSSKWTLIATVCGVLIMWAVVAGGA
jgi:ZIP family zinc transporter